MTDRCSRFTPWRDEAIERRKAGETLQSIGTRFGVTRERVRQVTSVAKSEPAVHAEVKALAMEIKHGPSRQFRKKALLALAEKGLSAKQAATHLRITSSSVNISAVKLGVKFRHGNRPKIFIDDNRLIAMFKAGATFEAIRQAFGAGSTASVRTQLHRLGYRIGFDTPKIGRRAYDRRLDKIHPEKSSANQAVYRAIKAGRMSRQPCVRCGAEKAIAHHDDYSKPLDVMWLCAKHHGERHRELRKLNVIPTIPARLHLPALPAPARTEAA